MLGKAIDHAEPQPRSIADRLGGEEGFENARRDLRLDPGTGIDHRYPDVVARLQHGIEQTGLDPVRARFQRERTALRHCVAGVERQIDQRIVELAGIDLGIERLAFDIDRQFHLVGQCVADQAGCLRHLFGNIDPLRGQRLLPREGQQAAGKFGSVARRRVDQFEPFAVRRAREIFGQRLCIAHDDHQHVVEVVGHPTGKLPQSLERLVLAQDVLDPPAFGDIAHRPDDADCRAVFRPDDRRPVLDQEV